MQLGHRSDGCFHIGDNAIDTVSSTRDLGIQVNANLTFSAHIKAIVTKAHARANLIHKCFLSKDSQTLTRAFTVYVRPLLEYASIVWSPYLVKDIRYVESVQRKFTKRIACLRNFDYADRLKILNLESLETRRLRFDLLYTYKMLFGFIHVDCESMFKFNSTSITRGHSYKLYATTSRVNLRHYFFCNRVVATWNSLPLSVDILSSFNRFKTFLYRIKLGETDELLQTV